MVGSAQNGVYNEDENEDSYNANEHFVKEHAK